MATGMSVQRRFCSWLVAAPLVVVGLTAACGFGRYDDAATPLQTSANDGVAGDGPWWPWACADGSAPIPTSTPQRFTAAGTCGSGGAFSLSVDGCAVQGSWAALGLSAVTTTVVSKTPERGGWQISATGSNAASVTCDAAASPAGVITLTCKEANATSAVCESTLTPVQS